MPTISLYIKTGNLETRTIDEPNAVNPTDTTVLVSRKFIYSIYEQQQKFYWCYHSMLSFRKN